MTASRVIFCEPVWRADVESQAIKVRLTTPFQCIQMLILANDQQRVHRIGQTKPVTGQSTSVEMHRYQPFEIKLINIVRTLMLLVKTLAIRSTMEEMMVSRRATLQNQAEKVARNWAEESGMRQFIAASHLSVTQRLFLNVLV